MSALTKSERSELARLEERIGAGIQTFHDVGRCLLAIRDGRLYRATHANFESYCQERWQFSRIHAFRLIEASEVVENLLPIGNIPANEFQARALAGLDAELQRQVWRQAQASGEVITADTLQDLAAEALASLPPEEQLAVIEGEERRVLEPAPRNPAGQAQLLAQFLRLLVRATKLLQRLECDREAVERHIGRGAQVARETQAA